MQIAGWAAQRAAEAVVSRATNRLGRIAKRRVAGAAHFISRDRAR
ncbi:hypothetical protein [Sphingomonas carotinifaciens]|nr:hypothetical protein [Sphingomonas carotinifaciens]